MSSDDNVEGLFSLAASREMEAHAFYTAASLKVQDTNVKEIFSQLAEDEMGHYALIEEFRASPDAMKKMSAPSVDWKVAESEDLPALSTDMKPKDAIALAMKKEQQAVELYRSLSAAATDASTKDIFDKLANMEAGHKHRLESVFVDIGYPEVF